MANGKNIEIRFATAGADAAAAEIRKVERAADDLADGLSDVAKSDPAGDALNERFEALRERLKNAKEEAASLGQETEKTGNKMNAAKAGAAGFAAGSAVIAKTFGEISDGLNSIDLKALRQLDAEMANQVEKAKEWAEWLSDPMAAMQRFVSGSTISEAFAAQNEQLALNVKQQAEAIDRMISKGRMTADELKKISTEIAAANQIMEAKADADAKARDAADAAAVRGGKPQDEVDAERAAFDRDQALAAINARVDAKSDITNRLFQDSRVANSNLADVKGNDKATPEQVAAAKKAADDAKKEFEKAKADLETEKAVAEQQRRGVRSEYQTRIEETSGARESRQEKERAAREKEEEQRQKEKQREEERAARDGLQGREDDFEGQTADVGRKFQNAGRNLAGRGRSGAAGALQDIGKDLANGADAAEIAALKDQFNEAMKGMGGETVAAMRAMLEELQRQAGEIAVMKGQIKNSRTGR